MQYFNFKRLIDKYLKEVTVIIPGKGDWDDSGDWKESEPTEIKISGAVIRHHQNKIYRSEGKLTSDDYAFYLYEKPNIDLMGVKVICDNQVFRVESKLDNSEFTGVWSYNLKYISAFEEDHK